MISLNKIRDTWRVCEHWGNTPLFAYLTIALLQLKVIWGVWQYKDLTFGDTSEYFVRAYHWFQSFSVDIAWSPLYTAFYGMLLFLSKDVYAITILHRLLIVFTVTLLVLALMRRLLPHAIAWLISAWWAILPINFNTLYEVHLFAIIPLLIAWLLLLASDRRWMRGGALGIACAASILVRNELAVVAALLVLLLIVWEVRLHKRANTFYRLSAYMISYGAPLLCAGLLCVFFYAHSTVKFAQLRRYSAEKHTLNMCQVYAFGYQQRYPGQWIKNPWTECYDLMETQFGQRLLSLPEMFQKNPTAVIEHIAWNCRLVPNGIQVALFNSASGQFNPDYAPTILNSLKALILSIVVEVLLIIGGGLLYRERRYWWQFWIKDRLLGWCAMGVNVLMLVCLVIPTQRPRPSYLFGLSIFLMALVGMCLFVLLHRWPICRRVARGMPLLMLALCVGVPGYYMSPQYQSPRQLLETYRRLVPFESIIARRDTVFLKGKYAGEIANFIGVGLPKTFGYDILPQRFSNLLTMLEFLDERKINLFYIDSFLLPKMPFDPFDSVFLTLIESTTDWKIVAFQKEIEPYWVLLQKKVDNKHSCRTMLFYELLT